MAAGETFEVSALRDASGVYMLSKNNELYTNTEGKDGRCDQRAEWRRLKPGVWMIRPVKGGRLQWSDVPADLNNRQQESTHTITDFHTFIHKHHTLFVYGGVWFIYALFYYLI